LIERKLAWVCWDTIKKESSKFQALYEQVERRHPSGIPYKEHPSAFGTVASIHGLPSRTAASIQVHVPAWTRFKYCLVFKETQDRIIALFLCGPWCFIQIEQLAFLEQTKLNYLCHHRRIYTFYVELFIYLHQVWTIWCAG
jgi:hypothetical protein